MTPRIGARPTPAAAARYGKSGNVFAIARTPLSSSGENPSCTFGGCGGVLGGVMVGGMTESCVAFGRGQLLHIEYDALYHGPALPPGRHLARVPNEPTSYLVTIPHCATMTPLRDPVGVGEVIGCDRLGELGVGSVVLKEEVGRSWSRHRDGLWYTTGETRGVPDEALGVVFRVLWVGRS